MGRKGIAEKVEGIAAPIISDAGMELVDVEYVREHEWYLRIYIDKDGGVDLQDCQLISEKIGSELDRYDFIGENYLLEVSSPGVDRVIKKDKDIIRYTGKKVDVKLFAPVDGKKQFTAELGGLTDDGNIILIIDGTSDKWERSAIAKMRLHFEF